jgi:hypothetical protein
MPHTTQPLVAPATCWPDTSPLAGPSHEWQHKQVCIVIDFVLHGDSVYDGAHTNA